MAIENMGVGQLKTLQDTYNGLKAESDKMKAMRRG
jgi:hypothetical protein